jgi:hypothetical protein
MYLTEGMFYPTLENTHFSHKHIEYFSKVHHMLGYKSSLNTFLKTEIISCVFSGYIRIKLQVNKKNGKYMGI